MVTRRGTSGEPPVAALHAFCKQMCPRPRLPEGPVYGGNDWYCAYGKNSQEMLLRIADLDLAPTRGVRPFTMVDMGWKEGSPDFPSMAKFAEPNLSAQRSSGSLDSPFGGSYRYG